MSRPRGSCNPLTVHEAAYIAGIVDGEGNIGLYHLNGRGENGYRPCPNLLLQVSGTNKELIDWLFRTTGVGRVKFKDHGKTHPTWKDCWAWETYSARAEDVLRRILPYMIVKKPQAELALEFRSLIPPYGDDYASKPTRVKLKLRSSYVDKMKALNRKGRPSLDSISVGA